LPIGHIEIYIEEKVNTKLLGLQIDSHINWKNYIEQMNPKLSAPRYAVWWVVHISNINTTKSIYCIYFHSGIKYGILFWGNCTNSGKIFTLKRKIARITASEKPRTSCTSLFKQLDILPVLCQQCTFIISFIIINP
jgi:hypothetical protein